MAPAVELLEESAVNPRMLYKNQSITGSEIEADDIMNDTRCSFTAVLMVKVSSVYHDHSAGVTEVSFENGTKRYIALDQEIEVLKFIRPFAS